MCWHCSKAIMFHRVDIVTLTLVLPTEQDLIATPVAVIRADDKHTDAIPFARSYVSPGVN